MQSSEDKIIQFHIARLKDKNSEVLLKTITELERYAEKAKAALPLLEMLYKTSEDESVKNAAKQAGRNIYFAVKGQEEAES